jgi:hypothetical protein
MKEHWRKARSSYRPKVRFALRGPEPYLNIIKSSQINKFAVWSANGVAHVAGEHTDIVYHDILDLCDLRLDFLDSISIRIVGIIILQVHQTISKGQRVVGEIQSRLA